MPIYQVDTQKKMEGNYWTNVWHLRAADIGSAIAAAAYIADFEISVHTTDVLFTSMRVSPYPGPSVGAIVPVGQYCQATPGDRLPLFNVARLDFPLQVGRPSRKYLRLPVGEGQSNNGLLIQGTIDFLQSKATQYLFNQAQIDLCDIHNHSLLSMVVYPAVGMRQLRRGSKKKDKPIIPVA